MKHFNVIIYEPNYKKFVAYDIIPYFVNILKEEFKEKKHKKFPKTFEEFKTFIISEGHYQFWGRCEYEVILVDWPCQKTERKIDVWEQIEMNLDIITEIIMKEINGD